MFYLFMNFKSYNLEATNEKRAQITEANVIQTA